MAFDPTFLWTMRVVGASHLALGMAHVVLWRSFDWSNEVARLSPLTARVFAVHTFFIAFILVALGALAAGRPDLLASPSDLARLLVGGALVFWTLRLVAQPLVFDPVLLPGSPYRRPVRTVATLGFAAYVLVYAWAFARQLDWGDGPIAGLNLRAPATWARIGVALVWITFGLVFKVFGAVPRHERIVARILGEAVAPSVTRLIGLGEALIGVWVLSGVLLPWCALFQTLLIVAMNAIELRRSRDLLLAPVPMVLANTALLGLAWFAALAPSAP
jgi:hypothetical protein